MTHKGECFCGAVRLEVQGEPEGMGYCHCRSCRSWSGGPVNAFTLWSPVAVKVTKGEDKLQSFSKTEFSHRKWCQACGGHVLSAHPSLDMVDVCAGMLPTLDFQPAMHLNYVETVLPMKDGLPKFRGFPKEAGGTGETVDE